MQMQGNAILRYSDDKIYNYIERLLKRSMRKTRIYLYTRYKNLNLKKNNINENKFQNSQTKKSIDYINLINNILTLIKEKKIFFDNIDIFLKYINDILDYSNIYFLKNSLNFNKNLYYTEIKISNNIITISSYYIQNEIFIVVPDNFLDLIFLDKENSISNALINLIIKMKIFLYKEKIKKEKDLINNIIVDIENFRLKYKLKKENILQIFNKLYFQKGFKTSKVNIDLLIKYISDVLFKFYRDTNGTLKWKETIIYLYNSYAMFFFFDKKITLISEANAVEVLKNSTKKYIEEIKYRKIDISINKEKNELLLVAIVEPFYTVKILFKNLNINDIINNINNFNYIKSKILSSDILVDCSCPDFIFGGYKYIATLKKYSLEKETRKPQIRNPKLQGSVCKHLHKLIYDIINNPKYIQFIQEKIKEYANIK